MADKLRALLGSRLDEIEKKKEMEDTAVFTGAELRKALTDLRYSALTVKGIADQISANRAKTPLPALTGSVTAAELEAALASFTRSGGPAPSGGVYIPYGSFSTARDLAEAVLKHAQDHREPAFKLGDVVRSASGQVYQRTQGGWLTFGSALTVADSVLVRPLTLIPRDRGV